MVVWRLENNQLVKGEILQGREFILSNVYSLKIIPLLFVADENYKCSK